MELSVFIFFCGMFKFLVLIDFGWIKSVNFVKGRVVYMVKSFVILYRIERGNLDKIGGRNGS